MVCIMIQILISTSNKLSVLLLGLRPHKVTTLNVVVGLDAYLLKSGHTVEHQLLVVLK